MLLCYVLHFTLEAVVTSSITVIPMLSHAVTEERVQTVLIPTPVTAMLATLVLIVRMISMNVRDRGAVKMVTVWMRSTLTPVSAMLAILVLIVRWILMSAC